MNSNNKIILLTESLNGIPKDLPSNIKHVQLTNDKIFKFLKGPSSWIFIRDYEKHLQDVSILNAVEIFSPISYQCVKFSKRNKKKTAIIVWETITKHPFYMVPPYNIFTTFVKKNADLFIAQTQRAKNHLIQLGICQEKIKVLYPGIDLLKFFPQKRISINKKIKILFIGKLTPYKGIKLLLQSFLNILKVNNNIELIICGKGPLENEIKKYACKYENIKYLGYVPTQILPDIYRSSDIFCYPSIDKKMLGLFKTWEEQFGYALVEAMASGLPIVSTNCGAIPEVIGNKNQIVKQNSIKDLHKGLLILLKDEDLRKSLSKENRKRAESFFDIKKQALKFEKMMNELLQV